MDPSVQVAFFSFLGIALTGVCGAFVAIWNNKNRTETPTEKALRERLEYKDEVIADLKTDVAQRDAVIADDKEVIREKDKRIEKLVGHGAMQEGTIKELREQLSRVAMDKIRKKP